MQIIEFDHVISVAGTLLDQTNALSDPTMSELINQHARDIFDRPLTMDSDDINELGKRQSGKIKEGYNYIRDRVRNDM